MASHIVFTFSFVLLAALLACSEAAVTQSGVVALDFSGVKDDKGTLTGKVVAKENLDGTTTVVVTGESGDGISENGPQSICDLLKTPKQGPLAPVWEKLAEKNGKECPLKKGEYDISKSTVEGEVQLTIISDAGTQEVIITDA